MAVFVLLAAAVILLCLALNRLSNKLGVPMLLASILPGMRFGTDGLLKLPFDNCPMAKQVVGEAVLLWTAGVILTAVVTGIFCYFVLHFAFWESMLIGAVASSTDAASVFSILRSKHLSLKYNTASLLEIESGSNDSCSYMLTVIILTIMREKASGGKLILMIFSQVVFGILIGVAIAELTYFVLKKLKVQTDGFDTIFVF